MRLVTEEELFEVIKSVNLRYAILLLQSYIQQYGALSDEIEEKIKNYFQDYLVERTISESDDAISRQSVLDYLKANVDDFPDYHEAIEKVLQMSPVTPSCDKCVMNGSGSKYCDNCTQKSGKWIYRREDKYSCSKCGTTTSVDESGIEEKPMYKFCPYCGAKMVEPQESEDEE